MVCGFISEIGSGGIELPKQKEALWAVLLGGNEILFCGKTTTWKSEGHDLRGIFRSIKSGNYQGEPHPGLIFEERIAPCIPKNLMSLFIHEQEQACFAAFLEANCSFAWEIIDTRQVNWAKYADSFWDQIFLDNWRKYPPSRNHGSITVKEEVELAKYIVNTDSISFQRKEE